MAENIIILGAGFSRLAGVPLMSELVDRMWEFAAKRKSNGRPLSKDDVVIFEKAMDVFSQLDGFHGRASFDDRNIEDVLSILSFNSLSGAKGSSRNLDEINQAISRTIELCCTIRHPGLSSDGNYTSNSEGPSSYRELWRTLIGCLPESGDIPTIITTNYDLVLERSLFQVLIGTVCGTDSRLPFSSVALRYHSGSIGTLLYSVRYRGYTRLTSDSQRVLSGTVLEPTEQHDEGTTQDFEILKLHGSLNFPRRRPEQKASSASFNPAVAVDDPIIAPPIFNKASDRSLERVWRRALKSLRDAKRVIVLGYSLPRTDIYMQFFLKAALGPNRNLDRITFFDPVLFNGSPERDEMESRYRDCFAPQVQKRLNFQPSRNLCSPEDVGTLDHLLACLNQTPDSILF